MQKTTRCQLAETCSFNQLWCGITLFLLSGESVPRGAASSIRAFIESKTWSNVSGTGLEVLVGNSNNPMKRQDAQIN